MPQACQYPFSVQGQPGCITTVWKVGHFGLRLEIWYVSQVLSEDILAAGHLPATLIQTSQVSVLDNVLSIMHIQGLDRYPLLDTVHML